MSDPRKGRSTQQGAPRKRRFSPRRIHRICTLLESDFSGNPHVEKAARNIAHSIREETTPQSEDLATVMMEMLYRRTRRKKRQKERRGDPGPKPLAAPKSPPPGKTRFSKRIEDTDKKNRGGRLRRKLRLSPTTQDKDDGHTVPGDPQ